MIKCILLVLAIVLTISFPVFMIPLLIALLAIVITWKALRTLIIVIPKALFKLAK